MQKSIRVLTALVLIELALAALGRFSPERWALLGIMALALLIPTTSLLGFLQLLQAKRG